MTPYKAVHCITDVLARATQCWPDKDAYRFNGQSLSYSQLADRVGRLTSALQSLGVAKGHRVGVFLPQSLELPVSVYGILGAGAAFVPIDPLAPKERVKEILRQCGIRVVVAAPRQARILEQLVEEGLTIDGLIGSSASATIGLSWDDVAAFQVSPPVPMVEMDIAYIMFTSGSTGKPKGMIHTHANGLIYADNLIRYHDLNEHDRFLNLSPLHFDMAIMDHLAALMVGATTIIVPESVARLAASLTKLAAEECASVWYSVPYVMIEMLLKGGMEKHDLSALRWMIYGGEAFQIKHLRALQTALPNARFCNAYGPAETHQVSSFEIGALSDDEDIVIPIGKPWSTVDVMIVDENDEPVESGESGELLVRAESCMLGYWGDPDRTDSAFRYTDIDGVCRQTFYRTGDLVSMQPDTTMYFHGRMDRQIKLRGNRVELDEVEAVLTGHESVADCAVIKSEDGTRLIAVVSLVIPGSFDAQALRNVCKLHLPAYAVPSDFVEVQEFARTSSLKIDRIALARQIKWRES